MIEIRCRCSSCAEISSAALDELLLVLPDGPDDPGPQIVHGCDHCGATTLRDIDERLAGLLLTHGIVAVPYVGQPAAEAHPENPPAGPAITADDVLAMHELLADDGWGTALAA
jgi:hypothetical protein